jgi:HPt (histidine-containing phosphotransfer) domain-containing protein
MAGRPTEGISLRLESLRRAYVAELPGRVRAIEEAAASLRPGDCEGLRSLYHLVHRLTGSSAVYGLPQLSRAAAELEDVLLAASSGTAQLEAGPRLGQLLAAVKSELAAARVAPPAPGQDGGPASS